MQFFKTTNYSGVSKKLKISSNILQINSPRSWHVTWLKSATGFQWDSVFNFCGITWRSPDNDISHHTDSIMALFHLTNGRVAQRDKMRAFRGHPPRGIHKLRRQFVTITLSLSLSLSLSCNSIIYVQEGLSRASSAVVGTRDIDLPFLGRPLIACRGTRCETHVRVTAFDVYRAAKGIV